MTAADLAIDILYYVAYFEAKSGSLPQPVAYPRRYVATTQSWSGKQPVHVFIDSRDRLHRAYEVDLLSYHATEAEALTQAAEALERMLCGVRGQVGVLMEEQNAV